MTSVTKVVFRTIVLVGLTFVMVVNAAGGLGPVPDPNGSNKFVTIAGR